MELTVELPVSVNFEPASTVTLTVPPVALVLTALELTEADEEAIICPLNVDLSFNVIVSDDVLPMAILPEIS